MDKDLIVLVLVPLVSPPRESTYSVGTGCAVGDGQILTARHVLEPEGRDPDRPIEICWYHQTRGCGDQGRRVKLADDALLWPCEDAKSDLDVALLACERNPDSLKHPSWPVARDLPRPNCEWDSRGFPSFADAKERNHFDASGTLLRKADSDEELTLQGTTVTFARGAGQAARDWAGASGMPVLVGQRLVGVVTRVLPDAQPPQFLAVPGARLWEDADFRARYRPPPVPPIRETIAGIVRDLLAQHPRLTSDLAEAVKVQKGQADDHSAVASAILEAPLGEFLDSCVEHQTRFLKQGDTAAVRLLAELAQAVLPVCHHEPDAIRDVCGQRQDTLVRLPVSSETVAEVLIAAADGRPTCFDVMSDEYDFPSGQPRIPPMPEGGRRGRLAQDLRTELCDRFEATSPEHMAHAFRQLLVHGLRIRSDWVEAGGLHNEALREHLDNVDNFLRQRMDAMWKRRHWAYYYILSLDLGPGGAPPANLLDKLAEIRETYPRISFLLRKPGMPGTELDPYHALLPLLYTAQEL